MSLQELIGALSHFSTQSLSNDDSAELLEDCQRKLDDALKTIKDRLAKIESKRKQEVAARTIEQLKAAGFSSEQIEEVRKSLGAGSSDKPKPPAKYRNPERPDQTWSGRGAEPKWIRKYYVEPGNKASGYRPEVLIANQST